MSDIYSSVYHRMRGIGLFNVPVGESVHLKSGGFMDLVVENFDGKRYSLTHYYSQAGDLVPDPDMEVRVDHANQVAEALSYQDSYRYQQVYQDGNVNLSVKKDLNVFLNQWLRNLTMQGFKLYKKDEAGKVIIAPQILSKKDKPIAVDASKLIVSPTGKVYSRTAHRRAEAGWGGKLTVNVKAGDIFYDQWGYDQTNIDFIVILAVSPTGKTVRARKLGQKNVGDAGFMSERVIPSVPIGESFRLKVDVFRGEPNLRGSYPMSAEQSYTRFGSFLKWKGSPEVQSHYA